MRTLELPAGAAVRFTATARPNRDIHYWDMRVLTGADIPLLSYRSQIGGGDIHQTVVVPVQAVDCRLELRSCHLTRGGRLADDQMSMQEDASDLLKIGFCDPSVPGSHPDDVLFSFAFTGAAGDGGGGGPRAATFPQ